MEIANKIKKFAAENDMIIRYEEFKRHRKEVTEAKKQREQQKYNKINDFIEKKIKKN